MICQIAENGSPEVRRQPRKFTEDSAALPALLAALNQNRRSSDLIGERHRTVFGPAPPFTEQVHHSNH
jgi:hypothetical protein